jgi:flagellin
MPAGLLQGGKHMRINTNLTALNTFTQYTNNNAKIKSSVEKLSSGSAINNAADNAAGLAISEKMRAQIRGLEKASTNAQDAISLVQTAEGSLNETTEILQRMRELAAQSASDTNEDEIDREALQDEFSQLQEELNDIAKNTTFNKKNLLDGSLSRTTKTLASTDLKNSGMTIDLGNAAAGTYNFSVTTKLESAAVAGKKPDSVELVIGDASGYFNNASVANTVSLSSGAAESALLNGNYKLSAEYGDDGNITVTAKGDNGQTFEAKIYASDLENLATAADADRTIKMTFNAEAGDAFEVTLGLTSNIASTKNNFDTLAQNISKTSVSISGGVTKKDAVYGVYANLTGAESIKLEAGMSSVSFSNGVKVNFDTLTASSVDTANKATGTTKVTSDPTNVFDGATGTESWSDFKAMDDAVVENGKWLISATSSNGITTFKAELGDIEYFAEAKTADLAVADGKTGIKTTALTFKDADSGKEMFNVSYKTDITAASTYTAGSATATLQVIGSGHNYSTIFGDATTGASIIATSVADANIDGDSTASWGNLVATSSSGIAAGKMTITVDNDGADSGVVDGALTFTAKDSAGNSYTASADNSAALLDSDGDAKTNTLTFTSTTDSSKTFTLDLYTVSDDQDADFFIDGSTTVDVLADLNATTASSFSVEEKLNAGLTFQVGANEGDEMTIFIDKMDSSYLGVASSSVGTREAASAAIGAVDRAINQVSSQRAYLGAIQNRLDHKIANLNTSAENLTSAESQIRDVDMAKEMTEFTNANILAQAATAMLAQANSLPQGVLSLLG